ncbi:cobyrinate a,c-diamide synthase [bacterium]|nr:cobyrinate a,c-diamide synthase [bacterium]
MSRCPGIVAAGLSGDSGKTLVALGLAAAWAKQGRTVAPFKKGPDYIDAAWLTLAASAPCRNLDSYLMEEATIRASWEGATAGADIGVIEGNRGLFDGVDAEGSHSTAALAKLLDLPLLLVIDATKMTRTTAALVLGVQTLDPELRLEGVILNRVAGKRHARVAREAIESVTGVPVVGIIPKLTNQGMIPGRHLGLVTTDEHPEARQAIARAAEVVEEHLDLERIFEIAGGGKDWKPSARMAAPARKRVKREGTVRIGVVRDAAFPFYYPENLEALEARGAEVVPVSALNGDGLPDDLHTLYIGGGFPETHAEQLAANRPFLDALHQAAQDGLPIYAECGGLMLLTESIEYKGRTYPMSKVLLVKIGWSKKPSGHGYTRGQVTRDNPFYPVGTDISGHEFHHSSLEEGQDIPGTVVELEKGTGVGGGHDGFVTNNVLALYTHVHAAGLPAWADGMIRAAKGYKG